MSRLKQFSAIAIFVLGMMAGVANTRASSASSSEDPRIKWLKANISQATGLPYSFQLPVDQVERQKVLAEIGPANSLDAIIERVIVKEGLNVYDGGCAQIAFAATGAKENLALAQVPVEVYWQGFFGELRSIRAGFAGAPSDQPFVYNPQDPFAVSPYHFPSDQGRRGFIFRIIDADGKYKTVDPLNPDKGSDYPGFPSNPIIHLEDWKPIAGENAWEAMAALQLFHAKYYDSATKSYKVSPTEIIRYPAYWQPGGEAIELALAKELARAALLLQAENGGIRMAPIGTYHSSGTDWYYKEISTENNCSWYAAFRMLFAITGDAKYKNALDNIERYFQAVWDAQNKVFYQGMHYTNGRWQVNAATFAVDCQTWAICVLGPEKIDSWFGPGAAFQMWQRTKELSSYNDARGKLLGVGYSGEHDRLSIEWTAGAVLACRMLTDYYKTSHPEASQDAVTMRDGIETFKHRMAAADPTSAAGYSYSSKRGPIPFGWNSHNPAVLSTTSTAWVYFLDANYNPFLLGGGLTPVSTTNLPPTTGSLTPNSGTFASGQAITFIGNYSDANGTDDLQYVLLVLDNGAKRVQLAYNLVTRKIALLDDNGSWIALYDAGSGGIIENKYLKLDCAKSRAYQQTHDPKTLVVEYACSFKDLAAGFWNLYSVAVNKGAKQSSRDAKGRINVATVVDYLAATAISQNQIQLRWLRNGGNYGSKIEIERKKEGGSFEPLPTPGKGVYLDNNLSSGSAYYYRIRAYNYAWDPAYSQVVSAVTHRPQDTTPPSKPKVTAGADFVNNRNALSARFSSEDPESGITEYQYRIVQRIPLTSNDGEWISQAAPKGLGISLVINNLKLIEGRTYYFAVRAKNGAGLFSEIGYSGGVKVDITPPAIAQIWGSKKTIAMAKVAGSLYRASLLKNQSLKYTITARDRAGNPSSSSQYSLKNK